MAKYVQFLKTENEILRSRIPGEIHTKPDERQPLLEFGKALGQAIEELITIVAVSTFDRWCREAESGKNKATPKNARRHRNINRLGFPRPHAWKLVDQTTYRTAEFFDLTGVFQRLEYQPENHRSTTITFLFRPEREVSD